jgi:hypothetical protein
LLAESSRRKAKDNDEDDDDDDRLVVVGRGPLRIERDNLVVRERKWALKGCTEHMHV